MSSEREQNSIWKLVRTSIPATPECALIIGSALLTVLSFPNFDLSFLAWIALVPFLFVVASAQTSRRAFVAGWLWGTIFFYGTCWWLTYPMIHFAHISAWFAYPLLLLPILLVALFPALGCAFGSRLIARFGATAIILIPFLWVSFDWLRYLITGQVWNAIGYSQAFHPLLIQSARWGGIYVVGFLVLMSNALLVYLALKKTRNAWVITAGGILIIAICIGASSFPGFTNRSSSVISKPDVVVVAVQPDVPMESVDEQTEQELIERHLALSSQGLKRWRETGGLDNMFGRTVDSDWAKDESVKTRSAISTLVIWPESPMNFSYSRDPHLRQVVADFARRNHTSILLNSLEPAKDGGDQNSAVMVNEEGAIAARYDKIRLMPFGEYVPLPQWLPGASSVRGIVGEFTPGSSYTLMPLGALRAGVFICIEAAHPGIARSFTNEGADVLINISNDGYLGPTPVMRQHLANAIFRAVENDRDLVRVTNTGITAFISSAGQTFDTTTGFQEATRTWTISKNNKSTTFYSRHGDVFVYGCALISLGFASASFMKRRLVQ